MFQDPMGPFGGGFGGLDEPKKLAMLGLVQGLLKAGQPSPMPVGLGGAMGQGIQGALSNYMMGQQISHHRQKMELEREEAKRKANMPVAAGPGTQLFKPGESAPYYTVPFKPDAPPAPMGPQSPVGKLAHDLQAGLITQDQFNEQFKKLTAPSAPLVNIDNKQDNEFGKAVGREFGDQYAGLMRADMNAPTTIGKYQRLGSLLGQVNTGKFKGATTDIKASAKSLGIDLTALGVADDVAPAQAARALSNQIALELRNPAGGAGMPGALSDKDREFLIQSIPGLENDPQAVGKMIEYRVKLAKREQEVAKKARAYRRDKGRFDEGFYDELAEWSAKNPLFPEADKAPAAAVPAAGGLTAQEQSELEQLRKRFKK